MSPVFQLALDFHSPQKTALPMQLAQQIRNTIRTLGRGAEYSDTDAIASLIGYGEDPFGQHFVRSVSAVDRRENGATFTPPWLVNLMLDQVSSRCTPARVVDPGSGTGRYAIAAARRWPGAEVIAIEKDKVLADAATLHAKLAKVKIRVVCADYLDFQLPKIDGPTVFLGNPPYVRHHQITEKAKLWYRSQMNLLGLTDSLLAGLHVYFFLKSHLLSRTGDVGCFVTAAEWLETNYGSGMRALFCRMGGEALLRVHPAQQVFDDALTTSLIATWQAGSKADVRFSDFQASQTEAAFAASHEQLLALPKWPSYGNRPPAPSTGNLTLGDFFKVSRGQVTGCNAIWIANSETQRLIPERYLVSCICDARDIMNANGILRQKSLLKKVIDLPRDLEGFTVRELTKVEKFLALAESAGAKDSYIARHRTPWWKVGLKPAPAIVMSYMGRRPPVFARNAARVPILNIAHGLVPITPLPITTQEKLVSWLNRNVSVAAGRTYGGGLVKFEPREAMRIPLLNPEHLVD